MSNPFRYFNSSPEVIRLVVMMYVRYPLSLRNVEDLLAERGIDISHETVRFWWNRFGPMFAAEIRKRRVAHMRGYPQWRWHLDEVFVKVNGKLCYLWRAVDHEGEVLEAVVTAKRDKAAALKLLKRIMKKYGPPQQHRHRRALLLFRGNERDWRRRSARGRWPPQQSGGEFASAVSTTRAGDAAVSKYEDAAEIQFSSRPGPQSFQSGAASRHPAGLQAETLDRIGGVARPCSVERRLREGVSPYASANRRYFDDAAPPDERGGNRHAQPNATASHLDFTVTGRPWPRDVPIAQMKQTGLNEFGSRASRSRAS